MISTIDEILTETQTGFPLDAFPKQVKHTIETLQSAGGYIPELTGIGLIAGTSAAIGNAIKFEYDNRQHNAIVYCVAIAPRGTGKSHMVEFGVKPLIVLNGEQYTVFESEMKEYNANNPEAKAPKLVRLVLQDYTPEVLRLRLSDNKRGLLVYNDELDSWFSNFNRYHAGGEESTWLSLFDGKAVNVDTKKSGSITIKNAFASVCGTIQPELLPKMAAGNRVESGFIDRFLFAFPNEVKIPPLSRKGLPEYLTKDWFTIIEKIREIDFAFDDVSKIITATPQADDILFNWINKERERRNNDDLYRTIGAKLETYSYRLCLILAVLRHVTEPETPLQVLPQDVNGAIKLVRYFEQTANKVHTIISGGYLESLSADKRRFFNLLPDEFTTAQALEVAAKINMTDINAKRTLKDKKLFDRVKHGSYQKKAQ